MVNVTAVKILIILALTDATSLHSQEYAASLDPEVFPDDLESLSVESHDHYDYENEVYTDGYKVCDTEDCKKVAEEFLSSMNKSVDPCSDFYEFACGGWSTKSPIPPSLPNWSRFMIFENTVKHRIKGSKEVQAPTTQCIDKRIKENKAVAFIRSRLGYRGSSVKTSKHCDSSALRVLETRPTPGDILPVRQAKKWYRSCMNIGRLERRSIEPIESIIMQTGGWPIVMDEEEWDEEESWQNVDRHYAHLLGSYVFYELDSEYKLFEADFGEINVLPSELPLFEQLPLSYRDYSSDNYEVYIDIVEEIVQLFVHRNRAVVSKRRVRREVKELVEFEKEIDKLKQQKGYAKFLLLDEFIGWYDSNMTEMNADPKTRIDWKSMIEDLFAMVNVNVNPSARLYFSNMAYIEGIPVLLGRTPVRTIVNYIHWKFVGNMLVYTSEKLRNKFSTLMSYELYGIEERPPRWLECVDDMKMTHAAAYAFVDKFFTNSTESAAVEMVQNIRAELEVNIDESNWLDAESKLMMKDKLGAMKILIGFPDWYWNRTAVMRFYKGLTIGTGYFDTILTNLRYEKKQKLKRYVIIKEKSSLWYIDPVTVNAMYGPNDNALNIPAVDFQSPLFTRGLPEWLTIHTKMLFKVKNNAYLPAGGFYTENMFSCSSVNYGVVGVLIGHEMGHAFDDCAIRFGKEGNDTELSEHMLKSYYERAECFVGQFNEYHSETIPPIEGPWNCKDSRDSEGERTAGENIADTTGLQAVFQAYKRVAEKKSVGEASLPGLEEFTNDQLFFISFADMWCEIDTPKFAELREQGKDVHSPVRLRVIGAVSNTKDFAKVFNCPVGSPMNPNDKCDIWNKSGIGSRTESGTGSHRYGTAQWRN